MSKKVKRNNKKDEDRNTTLELIVFITATLNLINTFIEFLQNIWSR